ncbi:hypothetical protein RHMOL_Rhmol07G0045300 [Rhododendron molle]|uniref:Uncharacterized protein n=1 Tax=Rhododendron molle TaxID=49168 RepID=A0ACC0MWU0_RHOML|nr:hypothetical protein RHMOL_Rhmol07G0045300 [Rhododendron molle]
MRIFTNSWRLWYVASTPTRKKLIDAALQLHDSEHSNIHGFKCLFAVSGFSRVRLQIGIPPISLVKEPKVFIHGNIRSKDVMNRNWPGCS